MNTLLPPPPPLSTSNTKHNRFLNNHHRNNFPTNLTVVHHTPLKTSSSPFLSETDTISQNDVVSHFPHTRYDFTPLISFLKSTNSVTTDSPQLSQTELRLAQTYRAIPAPLWHALLKTLTSSSSSSSSSSFETAYMLVIWLEKHRLCFKYELLYSILIHALGRAERLYEAFLLSRKVKLTPLTYNALIGACARNYEFEKAMNLMSEMRSEGYQSDFVNYSLIIQSLVRSNKIDCVLLGKLYDDMILDAIELDGQLLNDIVLGFAKSGDVDRAMYFLSLIQGKGMNARTSTVVALILELGNVGRAEEAEAIFEEIKEGGLVPRTRAYNAVLKGYAKNGSLRDAEMIVSEMERNGV